MFLFLRVLIRVLHPRAVILPHTLVFSTCLSVCLSVRLCSAVLCHLKLPEFLCFGIFLQYFLAEGFVRPRERLR